MPNEQPDLKKDNLWKLMCSMSLSGVLGMLVLSLNTFVDSLYVGHFLGRNALAGISLYFPVSVITTALTVLICAGGASVLSRAIGSGNVHIQKQLPGTVFTLALILSFFLACMGLFFSENLIAWMGGSGEVLNQGAAYCRVSSMGSFFTVTGLSLNALIRAEGRIQQAMQFTIVSVILNLLLTPLFIHLFSNGMEGAAWASNLGMCVYFILTVLYFTSGKASFQSGNIRLHLDLSLVKNILLIGYSSFLLHAGNFVRQTFIFKSVAFYGTDQDIALFGAMFRIVIFSITPVFGILQALQPIVGINYGAGNYERCTKSVIVFRIGAGLFLCFIWIPLLLFPQSILSIMLPDQSFSTADLNHFRIMLISMPLLPIASSSIIFFQAIGKGHVSGLLSIGRELLLFAPIILLFPFAFGMNGIYYGIAIENLIYIFTMLFVTMHTFNKFKKQSGNLQ